MASTGLNGGVGCDDDAEKGATKRAISDHGPPPVMKKTGRG